MFRFNSRTPRARLAFSRVSVAFHHAPRDKDQDNEGVWRFQFRRERDRHRFGDEHRRVSVCREGGP